MSTLLQLSQTHSGEQWRNKEKQIKCRQEKTAEDDNEPAAHTESHWDKTSAQLALIH